MKTEPTTSEERTLVMIKPGRALTQVGFIRSRLSGCGRIVEARMVMLTREAAMTLTDHLRPHPPLQRETWHRYKGNTAPVMVIEGPDITARVSSLVGKEPDPRSCAEGTLRYDLGRKLGYRTTYLGSGDYVYYDNFIMCSRAIGESVLYIRTLINSNLVSFPL